MKISFFVTCLADVFYPGVAKDAVEVLERLGCEVEFPQAQTCCGQPAYNSGYHKETKNIARHMIETFAGAEYVVTPSGSCAAMLHDYVKLFEDEPEWLEKARVLAAKTYEFTQFIVEVLRVEDVGAAFRANATYHRSCHMTRLLGVKEAPMKLLEHVEGLRVTPLPNAHDCCGFGGTFSVKMVPISEQMVDEKIRHIEETDAEVLIGADCGCLMNIGGRINRKGKPIKVMHIAQVLNHSKREGGGSYADENRE
ncbi:MULTISPECIES: (Fe-S)-binding protein [Aneurinibacillus]|uniref:Lactate utilization protein A n=1 Tax=Aneurinibacillus thermoaerophilus TaxID=143495 RepID=A0A1G7Y063_ANETH|nr:MULTISPECIES: (Fe-S)-binding protein [Aneurinibacillus]AMA72988.1 Fe-S oxidoreductase [Aneurinibacillus sp. XH2]MED0677789.1 (Fe-S)-binding protein [Aneurinibacillus thermoaerophilus]MED0737538.1 (Fe-S)-binding protein [Aneurinibacillus thermoaerophilus]MED0758109.1 (Fe-S)-binding protein [Aneurinibacillus thermoaerophilus]MED0761263.1 (Fe-S)-binding protein [Aneurinibacillus thermoaerophilus]